MASYGYARGKKRKSDFALEDERPRKGPRYGDIPTFAEVRTRDNPVRVVRCSSDSDIIRFTPPTEESGTSSHNALYTLTEQGHNDYDHLSGQRQSPGSVFSRLDGPSPKQPRLMPHSGEKQADEGTHRGGRGCKRGGRKGKGVYRGERSHSSSSPLQAADNLSPTGGKRGSRGRGGSGFRGGRGRQGIGRGRGRQEARGQGGPSRDLDIREAEKIKHIDFCNLGQLKDLLKVNVAHQVSSLLNNPSFLAYLKQFSLSFDFNSVVLMMNLLSNAACCEIEPLRKKIEMLVIPKLLENRGFLDSVRYHLCSLPMNTGDQERASSVSFLGHICKLFEIILASDDAIASAALPVDALWGTTRQLTTQEMRYQPLHNKAKELLEMRDKIRKTLHDTSEKTTFQNDYIALPTEDELKQKTLPVDLQRNMIDGPYPSVLQYLDIQYRLLREDFIHPLRCALHEIECDEEEAQSMKVYNNVTIQTEVYCTFDGSAFELSFRAQGHHQIRWDRSKRFTYGSLLCLMNDDFSLVLFATVAERNAEDLYRGVVAVKFRTKVDILSLPPTEFRMIESPGFYEAYAPVLRHLKALEDNPDTLPFSEYIVECKTVVNLPAYINDETEFVLDLHTAVCSESHAAGEQCLYRAVNVLDEQIWTDIPTQDLDPSQQKALRYALTRELAVIQGPPGTGKTYIGIKIVEILLLNRALWDYGGIKLAIVGEPHSPIVVVCYTNHALDQFLEGIIRQKGVTINKDTKVRRIGGRSKSKIVEEHNINVFVRNHLRARRIFGFWKKKNGKVVQKIDALNDLLKRKFDPSKLQIYASLIGQDIQLLIMESFNFPIFLNDNLTELAVWLGLKPLQTPALSSFSSHHDTAEADRRIAGEDDDEKEIVEKFGKEMLETFFEKFAKVEPLSEERAREVAQRDSIEPYVRLQLFKHSLKNVKTEFEEKLKMGKEREEVYEQQRRMAMIHCLREADIIGLTTTGAAKYNSILSEIKAKVVMIEEAAEVLEAHIVSSLTQSTQHLILIGDHQQLRPKTNDHILARNYHLNVSLFERLIKNGFPRVTLQVQHRMRPEISALVSSHIYKNDLIDAPSTEEYPPVVGMKYNMFFIDHIQQETLDHDTTSPKNDFEAHFMARLCRYLLQQNTYKEDQITVITPYTGQMYNLREKFKEMNMTSVKITPIDSYQGEENDIILLSLVRSEKPGFVKDVNRICVALSRAKHGLYVIGNFNKLFKRRSTMWKSVVSDMLTQGKLGTQLPLVCQGHQTLTEVGKPDDFDLVYDGGCLLPCQSRLPCNHMCPNKCHPNEEVHVKIKCQEPCPRYCPNGHRCKKKCYECSKGCGQCEEIVEKIIPKCGHQQQVPCYCSPEEFVCQEPCTEVLKCGHKCKMTCGEPHTVECEEYITREWRCKHVATVECYITEEKYSRTCKAPCGETLLCGHVCQGTCGECRQDRLHKQCQEKCNRTLTCGHPCISPCAKSCPACDKKCRFQCLHGPCDHKCYELCRPCSHKCKRTCEHQQCTRNCGEPCDCEPCNNPCSKKLDCGHDCMGLCGEECPDVCRICDKETFNNKVPLIFGTEDADNSELRIIRIDCGHMFDVTEMDKWMQSEDDQERIIQWKQCFICKKPIFKTNRYMDVIKGIVVDLNQIKEKELLMDKDERSLCQQELIAMIRTSKLTKNSNGIIESVPNISDKRLRAEYKIFCAEQRVSKAVSDENGEMDTCATSLLQSHKVNGDLEELVSAMKNLHSQGEDFISRLKHYRHQQSITEQMLYDVEAEKHRIHLLSVVLKVRSQILTKNIHICDNEKEYLEKIQTNYETRGTRVCKISAAEYDESTTYIEGLKIKYPNIVGISAKEKEMIIRALDAKPGSWYKCSNGHVYNIGQCGGAMVESQCPECKAPIGGHSHRLHSDNTHAGDFDRSQHAAWPEGANMGNYDLQNIQ